MEIVIATRNLNKLKELKELLKNLPVRILTLNNFPTMQKVEEDGSSFEENALKKALEVYKHTGLFTIADDSGLEVEALGGRPGIHSAYFSGRSATDQTNNEKLLSLLKGVPKAMRSARYVCAIAMVFLDGCHRIVRGECKGVIADKPSGKYGFGYDPLFFLPRYNKTMAEISPCLKNKISHRAIALKKACKIISKKIVDGIR
jgi:XTP/dITP diphosphohydrolase